MLKTTYAGPTEMSDAKVKRTCRALRLQQACSMNTRAQEESIQPSAATDHQHPPVTKLFCAPRAHAVSLHWSATSADVEDIVTICDACTLLCLGGLAEAVRNFPSSA